MARPQKALVVDDLAVNRLILGTILHKLGFEVLEAENGLQCIDVYNQERMQLVCIFLDLQMPVADGWTATKGIRALESQAPSAAQPRVPVVVCTASSLDDLVEGGETVAQRALSLGADGAVRKPLTTNAVQRILDEFAPRWRSSLGGNDAEPALILDTCNPTASTDARTTTEARWSESPATVNGADPAIGPTTRMCPVSCGPAAVHTPAEFHSPWPNNVYSTVPWRASAPGPARTAVHTQPMPGSSPCQPPAVPAPAPAASSRCPAGATATVASLIPDGTQRSRLGPQQPCIGSPSMPTRSESATGGWSCGRDAGSGGSCCSGSTAAAPSRTGVASVAPRCHSCEGPSSPTIATALATASAAASGCFAGAFWDHGSATGRHPTPNATSKIPAWARASNCISGPSGTASACGFLFDADDNGCHGPSGSAGCWGVAEPGQVASSSCELFASRGLLGLDRLSRDAAAPSVSESGRAVLGSRPRRMSCDFAAWMVGPDDSPSCPPPQLLPVAVAAGAQ